MRNSPLNRSCAQRAQLASNAAKVMLACNDEQGNWSGRVDCISVEINEDEWGFESYRENGETLKRLPATIRLAGHFFLPYSAYTTWVGNWCWDQVTCTAEDARRLLNYLWSSDRWLCASEEHPAAAQESPA